MPDQNPNDQTLTVIPNYIAQHLDNARQGIGDVREHLFTANGQRLSVQASKGHYSNPKESALPGSAYQSVEVFGWPTEEDWVPGFLAHINHTDPEQFAAFVSVNRLNEWIHLKGGLKVEHT